MHSIRKDMWEDQELIVGDMFRLVYEDVFGTITNIYEDEYGIPSSLVVENYDGGWVTIDLSKVSPCNPMLV